MKNNKLIIIAVIIIVLLAGLFFWNNLRSKKGTSNELTQTQKSEDIEKTEEAELDELSVEGSVFDLFKLGKNVSCTYSGTSEGTALTGTTHVSGKKMHGTYSVTTNGNTIEGNMVSDGEWLYTWTSEMPQGVKININKAEEELAGETSDGTSTESLTKDYNYKCTNWKVDESVFSVPTNITFTDLSQTLQDMGGAACTACNYITNETDKQACKDRLNCE